MIYDIQWFICKDARTEAGRARDVYEWGVSYESVMFECEWVMPYVNESRRMSYVVWGGFG